MQSTKIRQYCGIPNLFFSLRLTAFEIFCKKNFAFKDRLTRENELQRWQNYLIDQFGADPKFFVKMIERQLYF